MKLPIIIKLYAKPSDNIFIWGNNAQVYKLTNKLPPGKYAVAYHITKIIKTALVIPKAGLAEK